LLEERGKLHRVKVPVDPELEITEIADRVVKAGGPALLFEQVRGYGMPVLINAFGWSVWMRWRTVSESSCDPTCPAHSWGSYGRSWT